MATNNRLQIFFYLICFTIQFAYHVKLNNMKLFMLSNISIPILKDAREYIVFQVENKYFKTRHEVTNVTIIPQFLITCYQYNINHLFVSSLKDRLIEFIVHILNYCPNNLNFSNIDMSKLNFTEINDFSLSSQANGLVSIIVKYDIRSFVSNTTCFAISLKPNTTLETIKINNKLSSCFIEVDSSLIKAQLIINGRSYNGGSNGRSKRSLPFYFPGCRLVKDQPINIPGYITPVPGAFCTGDCNIEFNQLRNINNSLKISTFLSCGCCAPLDDFLDVVTVDGVLKKERFSIIGCTCI